ncbi:MAG: tetratricopeptide repeat protein [Candidatus Babeliaceae bacterium]
MSHTKKHFLWSFIYNKNTLYVLIGLAIVVGMSGAFYGLYHWYSINRDAKAQKVFSQLLQEFEQAHTADKQDFGNLGEGFRKGFEEHKNSSLAPYFLVFESAVLYDQHAYEQALSKLQEAINHFSTHDPLYYLYVTKLALIQLDASSENIRAQGLEALKKLAHTPKNNYRDMAYYWLGYHSKIQDHADEARSWFNELISLNGQSMWAQLAREKLTEIAA